MISSACHKITRRIDKIFREAQAKYDGWPQGRRDEYFEELMSLEMEWQSFPPEMRTEASHFYSPEGPKRQEREVSSKAQQLAF